MAKNVWVKIEKLVWHFSPKVPQCNFFIECRKLAPEQKVLKQLCGPERSRGSKSHFLPKNAFFGQKMTFFPKNHFIQNWSVIKTTLYAHAKKNIFKIKLWDCNFHQILPKHDTWRWYWIEYISLIMGLFWDFKTNISVTEYTFSTENWEG